MLTSGGTLTLTVPFVYPLHEAPHDYQRFTAYGLAHLFEPWFEIEEISELFSEEQTLAILLQRIAFQRGDSRLRRLLYHSLAHIVFRLARPRSGKERFRNIARTVPGAFLTANYCLRARRR